VVSFHFFSSSSSTPACAGASSDRGFTN